jgi:4-amino-4-deoxychorismate lyase
MTRLLESIRCLDGQLCNLSYHQKRIDAAFAHFFPDYPPVSLSSLPVPDHIHSGLYKCRIVYTTRIESVQFSPYTIRPVQSLKIVHAEQTLDYAHKFESRSQLENLFQQRGPADDILIIKNGLLTDSFYANVALKKGEKWYTPAQPLLEGTRRARLIEEGQIHPRDIRPKDLPTYQSIQLFNAMMPFNEGPLLPIANIIV